LTFVFVMAYNKS